MNSHPGLQYSPTPELPVSPPRGGGGATSNAGGPNSIFNNENLVQNGQGEFKTFSHSPLLSSLTHFRVKGCCSVSQSHPLNEVLASSLLMSIFQLLKPILNCLSRPPVSAASLLARSSSVESENSMVHSANNNNNNGEAHNQNGMDSGEEQVSQNGDKLIS